MARSEFARRFVWTAIPIALGIAVALLVVGNRAMQRNASPISDPRSTLDFMGAPGAGSVLPIQASQLPLVSDAIIDVRVIDVRPPRFNTADGSPPQIDATRGPEQIESLYVYTDVVMEVQDVRGVRQGKSHDIPPLGEQLTVVVQGGVVSWTLHADEAKALGVRHAGEEGPGKPESLSLPTGPVDFTMGSIPDVALSEGDTVTLFLRQEALPGWTRTERPPEWVIAHPLGVVAEGVSVMSHGDVDLGPLSAALREARGRALMPYELPAP